MRLESRPAFADLIAAAASNVLGRADECFSRADRERMAWAEGLVTAAAIGPERTRPDEWAKAVFGPDPKYDDAEQAQESFAMLAVMHNAVLNDLRRLGSNYSPFFLEHAADGEGQLLGAHWAAGFMTGTRLRREAWDSLMDSDQGKLRLAVIAGLLTDRGGNSLFLKGDAEEANAARLDALHWLGSAVFEISEYWKAHAGRARPVAVDPFRKIGRNEPCPCGSGSKYKKCCLLADQTRE